MTIRNGGGARGGRSQAHPLDSGSYDDAPLSDRDARLVYRPDGGREARNGGNGTHRGGIGGFLRFLAFALVLAAVVLVVAFTALRPLVAGTVTDWAYDNPSALKIPFVADVVRERLGSALSQPASSDATDVEFKVLKDDTIAAIATRLAAAGLVRDQRAFIFQATIRDLGPRLKEGNFRLAKSMTPDGIVTGLVENRIVVTVVPVNFREGLRLEQITAKLQTLDPPVTIDAEQFYGLVTKPPAALLADYPWLKTAGLPAGASLEGFLAPATYRITPRTTAEDLVRQMLDTFHQRVGDERMVVPKARGSFYQVLTLASLVDREAKLDEERPLIAGVFMNRLNPSLFPTRLLGSDPTVFYVNDTLRLAELPFDQWLTYTFWAKLPAELPAELPANLAGYNTYTHRGLMPGPICSPGLASIEAALEPNTKTGYLYFIAKNDGSNTSAFAKTHAEHLANVAKYGG